MRRQDACSCRAELARERGPLYRPGEESIGTQMGASAADAFGGKPVGVYRDMFARHHDQLALMVRLLDAVAIWLTARLASELRLFTAHAPIHPFVQCK